ncbi:MAG: hypothetical protein ABMA26_09765 [Limisphaerales bacterium]
MNFKPTSSSSQGGNNNSGNLPCKKFNGLFADVGVMHQPTSKAQAQTDDGRFVIPTLPAHPLIHFHQGPYPDMQSLVVGQLRKSALEAAVPSNDKCSPSRIIAMKIKINIAKTELAPERVHAATVTSIKAKGDTKCTIAFGIVADGNPFTVSKDYPAKLDRTSELLRDAETVLGRKFADTEANGEFDLETLVTKECQVVVRHRRSNGGRLVAAVETVLPASSPVLKAA